MVDEASGDFHFHNVWDLVQLLIHHAQLVANLIQRLHNLLVVGVAQEHAREGKNGTQGAQDLPHHLEHPRDLVQLAHRIHGLGNGAVSVDQEIEALLQFLQLFGITRNADLAEGLENVGTAFSLLHLGHWGGRTRFLALCESVTWLRALAQ